MLAPSWLMLSWLSYPSQHLLPRHSTTRSWHAPLIRISQYIHKIDRFDCKMWGSDKKKVDRMLLTGTGESESEHQEEEQGI